MNIYCYAIPHPIQRAGDHLGFAVGDDGEGYGSVFSSNYEFAKKDILRKNYPAAAEIIWIDNIADERLQSAIAKNHELYNQDGN